MMNLTKNGDCLVFNRLSSASAMLRLRCSLKLHWKSKRDALESPQGLFQWGPTSTLNVVQTGNHSFCWKPFSCNLLNNRNLRFRADNTSAVIVSCSVKSSQGIYDVGFDGSWLNPFKSSWPQLLLVWTSWSLMSKIQTNHVGGISQNWRFVEETWIFWQTKWTKRSKKWKIEKKSNLETWLNVTPTEGVKSWRWLIYLSYIHTLSIKGICKRA